MNNRGLLFSILCLMLVLSVFSLATYYVKVGVKEDIYSEKTRTVFADIATDLEDILGINARVYYDSGRTVVSVKDGFPLAGGITQLNEYKNFIENQYSSRVYSEIILSGLNNPEFTLEPTPLIYGYNSYNKDYIRIYNKTGDSEIYAYELYFDYDMNLVNVVDETQGGSKRILLNGSFSNMGFEDTYFVNPSGNSQLTLNFTTGKVFINVGRNSIDGSNHDYSIVLSKQGNTIGEVETRIIMEDIPIVGIRSNISVEFKDNIYRKDAIWLTPQIDLGECEKVCGIKGYAGGSCKQNSVCPGGGTHETEGDVYCKGGPQADTCCCQ